MRFNSIEECVSHKFVGNHAADGTALTAMFDFAKQTGGEVGYQAYQHAAVEGMGMEPTREEFDEFLATEE